MKMGKTLYEKVFDSHTVGRLPSGQYQLFMGLHLIHEVTSPQAFGMLRDLGLKVGVLDADVWGFSIPRMLGAFEPPTMVEGMIMPPQAYGVRVISMLPPPRSNIMPSRMSRVFVTPR